MFKIIGFYISVDALVRSFNIISLIFIVPIVSLDAQEIITYYTISFSVLTAVFSFSQLALVPKSVTLVNGRITLDLSVFFVGVLFLILAFFFALPLGNLWFTCACISAIGSFLYQSYQAGNNIHVRLKDLAFIDLFWLIFSFSILSILFLMEVSDERLRIFSHLVPLVFVSIFILRKVRFISPPEMGKSCLINMRLGFWMTIYSGIQWFLVFGDKMLLGIFNQKFLMVEIFTMTNILQLHLLGSLALVKAFKAKLLKSIDCLDMKILYSLAAWHISMSILGIVVSCLLYFIYLDWFELKLPSYNYLISYMLLYFSLGLTYFVYQVVVFIDEQKAVTFELLVYGLPLIFSVVLITWVTSNFFFIPLGFLIISLLVLVISVKIVTRKLSLMSIDI